MLAPWLEEGDLFRVTDSAPAAPPALNHPLLAGLASAAGGEVSGKLGWTDVAFFAERGVPAANFGRGPRVGPLGAEETGPGDHWSEPEPVSWAGSSENRTDLSVQFCG